jgi:hypothetical protein
VCNWTASFVVSVNYSGSWNTSYIAYYTNVKNVSGAYTGTGYNFTVFNINAYGLAEPTFCVSATKQDSSNATLTLSVGPADGGRGDTNSTALPNGSTSACFKEVL